MPQLVIGDHKIEVGEEFMTLPEEARQAWVNKLARTLGPKPDRTGQAFLHGAQEAATFNLRDELAGLVKAGGGDPRSLDTSLDRPVEAIKRFGGIQTLPEQLAPYGRAALGGVRKLMGNEEAQRAYQEEVDRRRAETKSLEEQHPYASLGGQLAGSVAMPFAAAARAPTTAARAVAAAKTGMVTGGISGFGAGEGGTGSAIGAGLGIVGGGLLGYAAPHVVEPVVGFASKRVVEPIANVIRGVRDRDTEALRRIGVAGAESRGLTRPQFEAEPSAINVDALGESGLALARSSTITAPEARGAFKKIASDRYEGQGPRIKEYMANKYGNPDPVAMEASAIEAKRAANAPNYARTYAEGDRPIWSPELEQLTASPKVQAALQGAQSKWKDYAVADGFGAMNPPFQVGAGGMLQQTGGRGMPATPNIQMWDYAARELQDAARAAPIGSETARLYNQLARQLKNALDKEVPSYKATRETAASFFNADTALEAGIKFMNDSGKFSIQGARATLTKMGDAERQLFKDGFTAAFIAKLDSTGDRVNLLTRIAGSPKAREELEVVYGKKGLDDLMARLHVESVMDRLRGALGGSDTTQKLFEAGLAGGAVGIVETARSGGDLYHGGIGAALGAAVWRSGGAIGARIDQRVAQRVGELLASRDLDLVERGIKMVASSKTLQKALAGADNLIARVIGGQARQGPPLAQQLGASQQQ